MYILNPKLGTSSSAKFPLRMDCRGEIVWQVFGLGPQIIRPQLSHSKALHLGLGNIVVQIWGRYKVIKYLEPWGSNGMFMQNYSCVDRLPTHSAYLGDAQGSLPSLSNARRKQ